VALTAGTRIGPYEIVAAIGKGGMGEVFRARDTRLQRDVAIKVLPDIFAGNADRLARFEREAQVLASVNHPNIAQVHGFEESGGIRALVMELVHGVTLSEVISGEFTAMRAEAGGLQLGGALAIARQIVDALEAAHERGIVHRDLKPANILVSADGHVKVLDFGLAKALERADATDPSPMNSPTAHVTEIGVVLGTAAYMAPEQARGHTVDKRADIWAFGVVMYEMLTGSAPFSGETATDVVAAVITREPDWSQLPPGTPAPLRRVLRRCLEKDPKRRLRDIADARAELEAPTAPDVIGPPPGLPREPARHRPAWLWIAGLVLMLSAGLAMGRWLLAPAPLIPVPVRFEMVMPERAQGVIAPDGSKIVLATTQGLVIRDFDQLEMRALPGTEGAQSPFWSEDSTTIVYGAKGRLWRLAVAGGPPALIAALPDPSWDQDAGGAWTTDGAVVFTTGSSGLLRVSAAGGDPIAVVDPAGPDELHFHHASGLPDSRGILFVTHRKSHPDTIELWADGQRRQLLRIEGSTLERPVYSPTGHILFTRFPTNFGLWAVPFSLARLEITGEPFLVVANAVAASVSRTSRLAYVPVRGTPHGRLTWVNREGQRIARVEEPRQFEAFPALSPDGTHVAVSERTDDRWDIWTHDSKSAARTRLTTDGFARLPVWMPDGRSLIYLSLAPGGPMTLKRVAADGSGLLEEIGPGMEPTVSHDGQSVLYSRNFNLFSRPLGGAGPEVPIATGPDPKSNVRAPRLSPNGRVLAYQSADASTLRPALLVTRFPAGGDRVEVARTGSNPRWSGDGRRLFFASEADLMEVDIQTEPRLRVGVARRLFSLPPLGASAVYSGFDVSPDGQRFLLIETEPAESIQRVVVVLNFALDN
jgi:eukaryotic-like serine/threonine-protein kinase